MAKRFKIRFRNQESFAAAQTVAESARNTVHPKGLSEFGSSLLQVKNDKRLYLSVEQPTNLPEDAGARQLNRQLEGFDKNFGAEIVEDFQYSLEADPFDPQQLSPDDPNDPSLDDVLELIKAREAWQSSTGGEVTIAVVDTGINGNRPEFPANKRAGQWQPLNDAPWTDWKGHGTMCAAIAAGTRAAGGMFDGVAPDAKLIACKTHFYDSELTAIYDYLIDLAQAENLNLIATNSYGIPAGTAPPPDPDSDFVAALDEAIAAGIKVFFSAGNYHDLTGGDLHACEPTSIWLYKCRNDVMTVATCDLELAMWYYSSRGPGQHCGDSDANFKPDVTAPTPAGGRIVYGNSVRSLANGWGTSGACPQVAGLAALLLSQNPNLSRERLFEIIRASATPLAHNATCSGTGLINCKQAIDSL